MNKVEEISIQKYLRNGSKNFYGREVGIEAREALNLSQKDNDEYSYIFIIPTETITISPSFFGGMLGDSVLKLGEKRFREKYSFLDTEKKLDESIKQDYEEGIYDALNGL